jgi:hypothetical protein
MEQAKLALLVGFHFLDSDISLFMMAEHLCSHHLSESPTIQHYYLWDEVSNLPLEDTVKS